MVIVDPVVLLFARSGAGKSSLVNAGLLPLLRAEGFDALPPTRVYGLTHQALGLPTDANLYLGNLVAGLAAGDESPSEGAGADVVSFLAARRAAQSGGAATTPRIIIIDQFEELLLPSPMPEVDRLAVFPRFSKRSMKTGGCVCCSSCVRSSSRRSSAIDTCCPIYFARASTSNRFAPRQRSTQ